MESEMTDVLRRSCAWDGAIRSISVTCSLVVDALLEYWRGGGREKWIGGATITSRYIGSACMNGDSRSGNLSRGPSSTKRHMCLLNV